MSRMKFHVKKGDEVEVISGNFKGSSGKILEVLSSKQRVLVEGVRIIKKHLRKSEDNPQGKIAEREGPIHISNVNGPFAFGDFALRIVFRFAQMLFNNPHAFNQHSLFA